MVMACVALASSSHLPFDGPPFQKQMGLESDLRTAIFPLDSTHDRCPTFLRIRRIAVTTR